MAVFLFSIPENQIVSTLLAPAFRQRAWDQTTVLDGVEFEFRFRYQKRSGSWYFRIFDASGVAKSHAMRVSSGSFLPADIAIPGSIAGSLFVAGGDDSDEDPTETNLGSDVTMDYLDAEEIA